MRDPRKDPRPGDVVRFPSEWTRTVTQVEGRYVTYVSNCNGKKMGTFEVTLHGWRDSSGIAEVIYANES